MSNTATPEVMAMGEIHLVGNITPHAWYKNILLDTGKPDNESITLLAEIAYWYRPTIVRSESTGEIISVNKKFKGELLQRSKKSFAEQFGYTERKVQDSLARLEKLGVITREYGKVEVPGSEIIGYNMMFIRIHPEKIKEISAVKVKECYTYGRNLPYPQQNSTTQAVEIYQDTYINTQIRKEKKKKKEDSISGIEFDRETKEFINISEADKAEWAKHYTGVDVDRELFQMRQWLLDPENPPRDGNRTFINNWLKRSFENPSKKSKKQSISNEPPQKTNKNGSIIPYDSSIGSMVLHDEGIEGYEEYLQSVSDPKHYQEYLKSKGREL